MGYEFPDDIAERITALLATGCYENMDEVLRAAIHSLEFQQQEVTAIQAGIDDMQAGRVNSISDFDRNFRQRNNIA